MLSIILLTFTECCPIRKHFQSSKISIKYKKSQNSNEIVSKSYRTSKKHFTSHINKNKRQLVRLTFLNMFLNIMARRFISLDEFTTDF